MNVEQVCLIIIIVCVFGMAACLLLMFILQCLIDRNEKKILEYTEEIRKCDLALQQMQEIDKMIVNGADIEDILKMPMPDDVREKFLTIYNEYKQGK